MRFAYVTGSRSREAKVRLSLHEAEVQKPLQYGSKKAWAHKDLSPHQARQLAGWLERSADTATRNALRPGGRVILKDSGTGSAYAVRPQEGK